MDDAVGRVLVRAHPVCMHAHTQHTQHVVLDRRAHWHCLCADTTFSVQRAVDRPGFTNNTLVVPCRPWCVRVCACVCVAAGAGEVWPAGSPDYVGDGPANAA
jgi:hypothetical protein